MMLEEIKALSNEDLLERYRFAVVEYDSTDKANHLLDAYEREILNRMRRS